MPTAENAILYYEAGQTPVAMTALTNAAGDYKDMKSAATMWSNRSGYEPVVRPNGLANGGAVTPESGGANDQIDVAALTCYLAGVLTSVGAAADTELTRQSSNDYKKFSVTVTAAGAIAIVNGTEHTAFSDTRGAAGGPPWIDNDAIEIAQIHLTSQVAAPVTASEIKQVNGSHLERYDYPVWTVEHSDVVNGILGYAGINFQSAMPAIHSEDAGTTVAGKLVYASYYTPSFAEVVDAFDFVPPANAHSVNSTQVYGRTKAAKSSTLNQGSFSVQLSDGITDGLMTFVDDNLWFKFYPNRLNNPYIICQGSLGVVANFPAGDNINAACTITSEVTADRING